MTSIRNNCNLSDEQYAARREELREGLMPLARGREHLSDGLALLFDSSAEMREKLEAFVAFERECCPGLGFSVHDAPRALRLEIHGIDPDASAFAGVGTGISLNTLQETPKRSGLLRVLRAVGLGGTVSLVICCVAPIGIAALIGAKLAAPLGVLDNPWVIALATISFASILWLRQRRHPSEPKAAATTGKCGC
ncbi:MAG: hypothetical protein JRG89_11040 [Deltaproteobacteria bacterium]|nr:hypothetical protein [Deltaproteobacteria bacterium]MBW2388957.1 hypothetical protein [Deltaproteobacteria bacterium]MBW2725083.1 hypothetical protein [Deltaproteobacteria bacterium]